MMWTLKWSYQLP